MLRLSSGSCMLRLGLGLRIGSCMLGLWLRLRLSFRGSGWPPLGNPNKGGKSGKGDALDAPESLGPKQRFEN